MKIQIDTNTFIRDDYGTSVALVEEKTYATGTTTEKVIGYFNNIPDALNRHGVAKVNAMNITTLAEYMSELRKEFDRMEALVKI